MNIFEQLLAVVAEQEKLTTDAEKKQYLESLQDVATALWESYWRRPVIANYSDTKTQHAYLLRYFPEYVSLLPALLRSLRKAGKPFSIPEFLRVAFVGCGPAPEIVGLLEYLNHLSDDKQTSSIIEPWFIDQEAEHWKPALASILKHVVSPRLNGVKLERGRSITADIMDTDFLRHIGSMKFHLVVFQNLFNEVSNYGQVEENVMQMLEEMPNGSYSLFIESTAKSSFKMLYRLRDLVWLRKTAKILLDADQPKLIVRTIPCESLHEQRRETLVDKNLYYQYPAGPPSLTCKNNMNFISLALQSCNA